MLLTGVLQAFAGDIAVQELKPGMRGYVYSVFSGTEPERFDVELLSIVEGPVAGGRYLLLKVRDESLRIGSGFSGSPVYFDGRLAGAISHMESNLTTQIAMAVPIAAMREDGRRTPRIAGGQGTPSGGALKPGSMIALPQVRGDFWMGASGTVTAVDDGQLLAFGHEHLFSGDSVRMPIHRATVHAIIPRLDNSHKEASPLEEVGSVVWDGKSAIVGQSGVTVAMTPLTVEYRAGGGRSYRLEILNHTRLAAGIITGVIRHIVASHLPYNPDSADIEVAMTITLKHLEKPVIISQRVSADQLKANNPASPSPLQTMLTALFHPVKEFESLQSVHIAVAPLPDARNSRIGEASFSRRTARPGDTVPLRVRLVAPYGEVRDVTARVTIPAGYQQPSFTVGVHAGKNVRPAEETPGSSGEIAAWLAGIARSDELVVLSPGATAASVYPEARLDRTIVRTDWNVDGSAEATIAVGGAE